MFSVGADALEHGFPPLSEVIARSTAAPTVLPLAAWKTRAFGAVILLSYSQHPEAEPGPSLLFGTYRRLGARWVSNGSFAGSSEWMGPQGPPGTVDGLEGRLIAAAGKLVDNDREPTGPAFVIWGWRAPEVTCIRLVHNEGFELGPANGHFGTWIIGTTQKNVERVEGIDARGQIVGLVLSHGVLNP
jgi:hypothetical protein